MLQQPRAFAYATSDGLGLERTACSDAVERWSERVQDTNNAKFVEARTSRNLSRADHTVRIGRWRENLSADAIDTVAWMLGDLPRTFGYDMPGPDRATLRGE